MADTKQHKRFLSVLAATFLLACAGAAGFNYRVDPYGLFGSPRVADFNELKPAASERVRVAKPYMASRVSPRVVIGGNSRPEIGLDPQSPCWGAADRPVFNAAIPGANVFMQTRYLQHAAEQGGARRILFGVDFLDFLIDAESRVGEVDWDRLGEGFDDRLRDAAGPVSFSAQQAEDLLIGLFSVAALRDSLATRLAQRDPHAATRREDGFNPAQDYLPIIRNEGQAVLFTQKNAEVKRQLQADALDVLDAAGNPSVALRSLRRLLQWAKARNVEVVLFINPYHSDYLVQIEASGKWPLLEAWKRQLSALADEFGVPLWDFNAFDAYSTESPPAPDDRHSMLAWFWEPAHYRKALGDLMLGTMLERSCGEAPRSATFGTRVTQATLRDHLDRLRSDMRAFIEQNPHVLPRVSGSVN